MRFTMQRGLTVPWYALFVPALYPGTVFRSLEHKTRASFPFSRSSKPSAPDSDTPTFAPISVLLSSPPVGGDLPWRVLQTQTSNPGDALEFLRRAGPVVSRSLSTQVVLLSVNPSDGAWEGILWKNGDEAMRAGNGVERYNTPIGLLQRAFFPHRVWFDLPPAARTWTKAQGLPITSLAKWIEPRRPARIVDYDVVAGLERKGLLLETNPVWYRITVDVPTGEPDSGIMEAR